MKKLVGHVSPDEMDEILRLFERRNGLTELVKILPADNLDLYERVINDLGTTTTKFQNWWKEMSEKYRWESENSGNWEIDFKTGDIYLIAGTPI